MAHGKSTGTTLLGGFASGDAVNFSDPFGLITCCDISDWSALKHIIEKHVEGKAGSGWNMWADMDESALRRVIQNTVRNGRLVARQVVDGEVRLIFERSWKTVLGTKGETIARVVATESGELRTAFPVTNSLVPMLEQSAKAGVVGSLTRAATKVTAFGTVIGAVLNVILSPKDAY